MKYLQVGGDAAFQPGGISSDIVLLITEAPPGKPSVGKIGAQEQGSAECLICLLRLTQTLRKMLLQNVNPELLRVCMTPFEFMQKLMQHCGVSDH